jgi:hypothetical protein
VNLRLLRLAAFVVSDAGLILLVLTFILRLGLDSIEALVGTILMAIGLVLILWCGALKPREGKK